MVVFLFFAEPQLKPVAQGLNELSCRWWLTAGQPPTAWLLDFGANSGTVASTIERRFVGGRIELT